MNFYFQLWTVKIMKIISCPKYSGIFNYDEKILKW